MSRPDPLAVMRLLRRAELEAARQQAAEVLDRRRQAEQAVTATMLAVAEEKRSAEPAAYAGWVSAPRAELALLASRLSAAEASVTLAQNKVVAAKLSEQLVMDAQQRQRQAMRRKRLAKEQKLLDDL
ncbi:hypothetical protein [Falsiroseomonas ponticola]|uniref:hypothetical protein n=1 Tax=Falsiroseomonas ponticola TaxID=2786951 RepID=UPI001932DD26|nr:hypothetical protein [Roseomonas ponticola]